MSKPAEWGVILKMRFVSEWFSYSVTLPYVCNSEPSLPSSPAEAFLDFVPNRFYTWWQPAFSNSLRISEVHLAAMVKGTIIPFRRNYIEENLTGGLIPFPTTEKVTVNLVGYSYEQSQVEDRVWKCNTNIGPPCTSQVTPSNLLTNADLVKFQNFCDGIRGWVSPVTGETWRRCLEARRGFTDIVYPLDEWYPRRELFTRSNRRSSGV